MIERLINVLKSNGVDGYKIINTRIQSNEFFFIGHRLDMNRAKDVDHTMLTVYKALEDKKYLGSATHEIYPNLNDGEIDTIVKELMYSAAFVKNPYFELSKSSAPKTYPAIKIDALQVAKDIIAAVHSVKETADQNINSYEVFVNERQIRIINSNGVDVECSTVDSQIEIIVNARKDGHEIEIYRNYNAGTCDKAYLSAELAATLQIGKDRTDATPTPKLKQAKVLLSGVNVVELLSYYTRMTNVGNIHMQISDYKLNEPVTTEDPQGDKISLTGVVDLPNSSKNMPFDNDGNPISDRVLIKDGVCVDYWGNEQFSQYVGKSDPDDLRNFRFSGGKDSYKTFMQDRYLQAVEFSDFQCDAATGNFAGEIRLAYYFDGTKTIPVSGGSIAGNIKDVENTIRLSSEVKQYDNYVVPEYVCMYEVNVTGIGE